jgi:hypothetical protein
MKNKDLCQSFTRQPSPKSSFGNIPGNMAQISPRTVTLRETRREGREERRELRHEGREEGVRSGKANKSFGCLV